MYFLEENYGKKEPGKVRSALSKGAHATYNGLNSKPGRIASGAVGGLGAAGAAGAIVRIKQLEKKLSKTVNPAKRAKIAKEINMLKKVAIAGGAVGVVGGGVAAGGLKAANKGRHWVMNKSAARKAKNAAPDAPVAPEAAAAAEEAATEEAAKPGSTNESIGMAYLEAYYDALDEDYLDYDAIEQAYLEGYYGQLAEMGYYDEDYDDYDDYEDYDEDDAYLEGYYTALEELDLV